VAFTYANHGDGHQIVWANGKWVIVTNTLSAADVVQFAFEEDAAGTTISCTLGAVVVAGYNPTAGLYPATVI